MRVALLCQIPIYTKTFLIHGIDVMVIFVKPMKKRKLEKVIAIGNLTRDGSFACHNYLRSGEALPLFLFQSGKSYYSLVLDKKAKK